MNRVLIFSTAYLPDIGGAEIAVKEITDRISNVHFDLLTVARDPSYPRSEQIGNVKIYRIGNGFWGKLFFPLRSLLFASYLHLKHPYKVVWGIMASYGGVSALFFKLTHRKVRFVLSLQEGDSLEYIKHKTRYFRPLYRMIFKKADTISAISNFLAEFAKSQGYTKKVEIIPNGVNIKKFSSEKPRNYSGEIRVVTTSRLVSKNGVDVLVRAMCFLPDKFRLVIVGDGPERNTLESIVEANNLSDRVEFSGSVPYEKIPAFLFDSHIFARPARSEGLGNSFLEAMASGLPIVGTSVGGIPDFLFEPQNKFKKEPTGLFAEVDNPESVAEAIKRLVEDGSLREQIIKNARALVQKKYDWNLLAKEMENVLFKQ